jgi:hypothetical protein
MIRRRSIAETLLFHLLMGIAVTILSVGSLINFHQYKIWHKPLIPKLIAYKRDHEDLAKIIFLAKNLQKDSPVQKITGDFGSAVLPCENSISFSLTGHSLSYHSTFYDYSRQLLPSTGLRAPPAC